MEIDYNGSITPLWPVAGIILVLLVGVMWRRKHALAYLFCFFVFGVYVLFAVDRVFFPIRIGELYVAARVTPEQFLWAINLIPFKFDFSELPNIVLRQIFQNILLTVPFGFGINFVASVRGRRILWLALAVGLGIEAVQLVIGLVIGYPYRIIDINDVLLNGLGVLIGYGIFQVCAWGWSRINALGASRAVKEKSA